MLYYTTAACEKQVSAFFRRGRSPICPESFGIPPQIFNLGGREGGAAVGTAPCGCPSFLPPSRVSLPCRNPCPDLSSLKAVCGLKDLSFFSPPIYGGTQGGLLPAFRFQPFSVCLVLVFGSFPNFVGEVRRASSSSSQKTLNPCFPILLITLSA
jgi:hypothetical protein